MKKGVSLIVLIITIIVIVIISTAVILSLSVNNPIDQVSKSVYSIDTRTFQAELELYKMRRLSEDGGTYNPDLLQADDATLKYNGNYDMSSTIYDIIPSLATNSAYAGQFKILDGKLIFQGNSDEKQTWSEELGIEVIEATEPSIAILSPNRILAEQGTDIIYTVKVTSNSAINNINLTGKVFVTDESFINLSSQPNIIIGEVTNISNYIKEFTITIKTETLPNNSYNLKIESNAISNANGYSNTSAVDSFIGFEMLDETPPENPVVVATPTLPTNANVNVEITYSADSSTKEYSFDATNWLSYTAPIVVSVNNTTIYARGKDYAGNESGSSTITIANIDKTAPVNPTMTSVPINGISPASQNVVFGESSSSYQSRVVNIPNLNSVTSSSVNTGSVSTTKSGNDVTVVVSGGSSSRSVWDSTKYSTYASTTSTSYSNSFSSYISYSSGGYSGTLSASGGSYVYSGSYSPSDSYYATAGASQSGSLCWACTPGGVPASYGSSYYYSSGGYSGTLSQTNYVYNINQSGSYCSTHKTNAIWNFSRSWSYGGTVTRPGYDTRIYAQNYSGYIYAGGYTDYYSYTATLNYLVGSTTTANVTISYPADAVLKQYSLNGTTWNTYTGVLTVALNSTVYSRCYDEAGNVSSVVSKVAN